LVNTHIQAARVILVDDHPAVLRQVEELLPDDFEVVAALEEGGGLAKAVEEHQPDLIVLDISLPGASGIELASRLQTAGYPGKVVFLTVHSDPDYARAAFAAGAIGYVVKTQLASDLIPALRAALAGKRFVSPCPELEGIWGNNGGNGETNHKPKPK
jgi:DNA-binding NarL/FixJ family response regulator